MPNNIINYDQTDVPVASCQQGQVVEDLISVPPINIRRKSKGSLACSYLIHWVQFKPEQMVCPDGDQRISRGRRNLGCIVICLDYPEEQLFGQILEEMTHKQWVNLLKRLNVFENVYDRLGLTAAERLLVGWQSEPLMYFKRNQFVTTHWKLVRIMEENPNLKVKMLSLSKLVDAAYVAARQG